VNAEAVMTDAERTQFIARTPPPPVSVPRHDMDEPPPEGQRRHGLIWLAIVIALLVVIGGAVAAILLIGKSDHKVAKVTIPQSVVGQTPAAAEAALKTAGFVPLLNDSPTGGPCDGGVKGVDGRVCKLNPAAGTEAEKGSTVQYQIYKAPSVQVPYLIGLTYNDAVNKLHTLGLKAKQKAVDTNQYAAGIVATQSEQQYTEVPPGATVVLGVSTGKVKLVDVRGLKVSDAVGKLNQAGWTNVDATQTLDTTVKSKDGTVAQEAPTPGFAYTQDTQITLTYYKYVKPAPTCTTPPPVTDTPGPTDTGIPSGGGLPPCTSSTP
jgi:serine/threonine-protein kinase